MHIVRGRGGVEKSRRQRTHPPATLVTKEGSCVMSCDVIFCLVKDFFDEHTHVEMSPSWREPSFDPTLSCSQQWSLLNNAAAAAALA